MYSIGQLSKSTGVKIPTIRYYEDAGLLTAIGRTRGNQRRYGKPELERLGFIKHARDLGFTISAILALIELQNHPDKSCNAATEIAQTQLADVRNKIRLLKVLEEELQRITEGCSGNGVIGKCYVLASLADHQNCVTDH